MDSIGVLVTTQRRLLEERNSLISHWHIQSLPGLENFLKPPSFDLLISAAAHGPVIITNQSQFRLYVILLLLKDPHPSVYSTPPNFYDRKGLDSKDYGLTLASVLADLYELVGKPIIEKLRQLEVPESLGSGGVQLARSTLFHLMRWTNPFKPAWPMKDCTSRLQ
ncbi:hypothetical protein EI94DRAFT_1834578 [Lactarius quietus]|nr:hypothetical protein EI94DRAFT_1834578 [Lactarius quietus]